MTFVNEREKHRTIDYERNIVLERGSGIHGSGRPSAPNPDDPIKDNFILKGDDFQVRIEGYLTGEDSENNKRDLTWHIHRIWDVEGIHERENEIIDLIVEAINTYGVYFGKKNINSITVEFGDFCSALTKETDFEPIRTLERDF